MARASRVTLNLVPPNAARTADYTLLLFPTIKVTPAGDTLLCMLQLQDWLEVHAKDNEVPGSDIGVAKALQQYHQHHVELPCPDGGSHALSENDNSDINSPQLFNFLIMLGGDGTVLFTSWLFQQIVPPVLPFALGSLGFLTNFDFTDYQMVVDSAIDSVRFGCLLTADRDAAVGIAKAREEMGPRTDEDLLLTPELAALALTQGHRLKFSCSVKSCSRSRMPSPALSNSSDDSEIQLTPQAIDKGHYVAPSAAGEPAPQKPQSQSQPQPQPSQQQRQQAPSQQTSNNGRQNGAASALSQTRQAQRSGLVNQAVFRNGTPTR
ncbi:hypothetical protein EDD22DRAFT_853176 [Suillus occidentalis]|nr:hypothetical protein EDD22DRAFT_853176 [Suillus occidentalis]